MAASFLTRAPNSFRRPNLVPGQCQKICPEHFDITAHSAGSLNRVNMQQAADAVHQRSRLQDRLNNTGLIVGKHDRNQDRAIDPGKPARQHIQVDLPVPGNRQMLDGGRRKTAARQDRRVLDGGDQKLSPRGFARSGRRRERQHIRFSAPGSECNVARLGTDQRGNVITRLFHKMARCSPFGMNRGWIADDVQGGKNGCTRLGAQGRRRIPVEIETLTHAADQANIRSRGEERRSSNGACFLTPHPC